MYILCTEGEIYGVFSTELKAQVAKQKIVQEEIADWLSTGDGLDEVLAEASQEEYSKYCNGEIKIEDFSKYNDYVKDWMDCFYITEVTIDEIRRINLI